METNVLKNVSNVSRFEQLSCQSMRFFKNRAAFVLKYHAEIASLLQIT